MRSSTPTAAAKRSFHTVGAKKRSRSFFLFCRCSQSHSLISSLSASTFMAQDYSAISTCADSSQNHCLTLHETANCGQSWASYSCFVPPERIKNFAWYIRQALHDLAIELDRTSEETSRNLRPEWTSYLEEQSQTAWLCWISSNMLLGHAPWSVCTLTVHSDAVFPEIDGYLEL